MHGSCDELHACAKSRADVFAGKRDCRQTREADGCGVTEDSWADAGLVVSRVQFADWSAGYEEEIDPLEEQRHLGAK